ncbi:MAG: hypothetical protein OXT67_10790 [Zetaproteobacteria bacterium]|nr:hypothetical protein [Zetaproteobacteria bacterium]
MQRSAQRSLWWILFFYAVSSIPSLAAKVAVTDAQHLQPMSRLAERVSFKVRGEHVYSFLERDRLSLVAYDAAKQMVFMTHHILVELEANRDFWNARLHAWVPHFWAVSPRKGPVFGGERRYIHAHMEDLDEAIEYYTSVMGYLVDDCHRLRDASSHEQSHQVIYALTQMMKVVLTEVKATLPLEYVQPDLSAQDYFKHLHQDLHQVVEVLGRYKTVALQRALVGKRFSFWERNWLLFTTWGLAGSALGVASLASPRFFQQVSATWARAGRWVHNFMQQQVQGTISWAVDKVSRSLGIGSSCGQAGQEANKLGEGVELSKRGLAQISAGLRRLSLYLDGGLMANHEALRVELQRWFPVRLQVHRGPNGGRRGAHFQVTFLEDSEGGADQQALIALDDCLHWVKQVNLDQARDRPDAGEDISHAVEGVGFVQGERAQLKEQFRQMLTYPSMSLMHLCHKGPTLGQAAPSRGVKLMLGALGGASFADYFTPLGRVTTRAVFGEVREGMYEAVGGLRSSLDGLENLFQDSTMEARRWASALLLITSPILMGKIAYSVGDLVHLRRNRARAQWQQLFARMHEDMILVEEEKVDVRLRGVMVKYIIRGRQLLRSCQFQHVGRVLAQLRMLERTDSFTQATQIAEQLAKKASVRAVW